VAQIVQPELLEISTLDRRIVRFTDASNGSLDVRRPAASTGRCNTICYKSFL
jgi:hypothetical protein